VTAVVVAVMTLMMFFIIWLDEPAAGGGTRDRGEWLIASGEGRFAGEQCRL